MGLMVQEGIPEVVAGTSRRTDHLAETKAKAAQCAGTQLPGTRCRGALPKASSPGVYKGMFWTDGGVGALYSKRGV